MKKLISFYFLIISVGLSASTMQSTISAKTNTALIDAVKKGNTKAIKNLLKENPTAINELGIDQKTALDHAVEHGDSKIVHLLAKYGGRVTSLDNQKYLKEAFLDRSFFVRIILNVGFNLAATILSAGIFMSFFMLIEGGFSAMAVCLSVAILPMILVVVPCKINLRTLENNSKQNWMIQIPDNLA